MHRNKQNYHIKIQHAKEDLIQCKRFSVYYIKMHEETHKKLKKFRCQYEGCGKIFNRKIHLDHHKITYWDEMIKCSDERCSFETKSYIKMTKHLRKHYKVKV